MSGWISWEKIRLHVFGCAVGSVVLFVLFRERKLDPFTALDLCHTMLVNGDQDLAQDESLDFLPDDLNPVLWLLRYAFRNCLVHDVWV